MKIINTERQAEKADGLIFAAYAAHARIITPTKNMAEQVRVRAEELGYDILCPMGFDEYMRRGFVRAFAPDNKPPILIDEVALEWEWGASVDPGRGITSYVQCQYYGGNYVRTANQKSA